MNGPMLLSFYEQLSKINVGIGETSQAVTPSYIDDFTLITNPCFAK